MPDTPQRMSRVDTAWLRMDNDVNLMMIVGVWLLQPAISYQALCERIEDKLLKYPRFRQKVVQDTMGASWVHDDEFDLHRHLVQEKLPLAAAKGRGKSKAASVSERTALQARAGELAHTALDHAHPLWQFHFIPHYDGGTAIICRIHHCIGDGVALNSVMMSIADDGEQDRKSVV